MMGYGYSGAWGGFGAVLFLYNVVILADLILLGVWLWKQIQRK